MAGSLTTVKKQGTRSNNKPKVPVPGSSTVTIRQGTSPSLFSDEDFEAFADRFTSLGEVKKEIKKVVDVDIGLIFGMDTDPEYFLCVCLGGLFFMMLRFLIGERREGSAPLILDFLVAYEVHQGLPGRSSCADTDNSVVMLTLNF